jgi:hypothetical protein
MAETPKPKTRHGSETRKRTFSVRVRLDDGEQINLESRAGEAGLSLPAYLRATGLGAAGPRARRRPPLERELLAHTNASLNRIGNNLNQIAKALNQAEAARRGGILGHLTGRGQRVEAETIAGIQTARAELLDALAKIRRALGYDSEG